MKTPKVDVAVLLLFFTRTEITKYTFAQICKARPSKLFLYQDGPRLNNPDDQNKLLECRAVVENMIDWDCEIHRLYQTKNYGCDPSEYISQKWMFSYVDKGIIIEDDDVMSVSFFQYCKELLDKYENDTRINMICGQNHLGTYNAEGTDYIFSKCGPIWGWATWRRTIDMWDSQYKALEDKYSTTVLEDTLGAKNWHAFQMECLEHKQTGREHYETIRIMNQLCNSQFNIIPTKNMTCNIGIGVETTHYSADPLKISRWSRSLLFSDIYEIQFPLKHPKYVIEDTIYQRLYDDKMFGNQLSRLFRLRKIESMLKMLMPFLNKIGSAEYLKRIENFKNKI